MAAVLTAKQFEETLVALDLSHRRAIWRMIKNGMPRPERYPDLHIQCVVVADEQDINAIQRTQATSDDGQETIDDMPLIESVSTRTNTGTQGSKRTATETGKDVQASEDTSEASSHDTDTSRQQSQQTQSSENQLSKGTKQLIDQFADS